MPEESVWSTFFSPSETLLRLGLLPSCQTVVDFGCGYGTFAILHIEDPAGLLREAHRILKPGGLLGIMHWNYDPKTPRGPPMNIMQPHSMSRSRCRPSWMAGARFSPVGHA